ncbi:hypothetical protein D3260_07700 [Salinisphaera sp. Q1T1-3]|nr:hypothetical protein D3260_07700 [Salinisphaera sp. Q1T1-3]
MEASTTYSRGFFRGLTPIIPELIDRRVFASRQAARTAIFEYIEVFYNRQCIHQTPGYRTPLEVEETHQAFA